MYNPTNKVVSNFTNSQSEDIKKPITNFVYKNIVTPTIINDDLRIELATYGITNIDGMLPSEIFSWENLFTIKGFLMMVVGGFMIGFGSRYAGGCTSGHSISGLSNLQLPSLIATCCFFIGGLIMANIILPYILSL